MNVMSRSLSKQWSKNVSQRRTNTIRTSSNCVSGIVAVTMLLPFTKSFTASSVITKRIRIPRKDNFHQPIHSLFRRYKRHQPNNSKRFRYFSSSILSSSEGKSNNCEEGIHGKSTRLISFFSDVEGDAGYFDRFVRASRILDFEKVEPNFSEGLDYFPYDKRVVFQTCAEEENKEETPIEENNFAETWDKAQGMGIDIDMAKPMLVFGGDTWDKGGNDLYVIRQLLSLHRRYHGRVHFIMGNRDINKMRICQELAIDNDGSLAPHGGVYWFKNTGLQGDPELIGKIKSKERRDDNIDHSDVFISSNPVGRLKWILRKTMGAPDAFEFRRKELKQEKEFRMAYESSSTSLPLPSSLKESENTSSTKVSDEEVVDSYLTSCHPNGEMGEYLSNAKLCFRIGGVLFMHGALPITQTVLSTYKQKASASTSSFWTWFYEYASPFLRSKDSAEKRLATLDDWADELNAFAKDQSNIWKQNITISDERRNLENENREKEVFWASVGGYQTAENHFGSLNQYGMGWLPDREQNPTVVYNSWMRDGMPKYFYDDDEDALSYKKIVKEFFDHSKLDAVITGHQPVGDAPFPIQIEMGDCKQNNKQRQLIICADTSYSGDTKWMSNDDDTRKNLGRGNAVSGRGDVAVSEILLEQCPHTGRICNIFTHGVLSDGTSYESANFQEDSESGVLVDRGDFSFEGSIQDDTFDELKWHVKSKFKDLNDISDSTFLVSTGKGYEVFNSIAKRKEVD